MYRWLSNSDRWFKSITTSLAIFVAMLVSFIFIFVAWESWPALHQIPLHRFLTDGHWYPTQGEYDLLPMIIGSLACALGAVLVATPLGIFGGVYCRYHAPTWVATIYRRIIELLSGIPSVIFGLWGLINVVPMVAAWNPPGTSLLAGILVLAAMILPTIAVMTDQSLGQVPHSYRISSEALGLARNTYILKVALPHARPGIVSGILLALGRALGETMAILMVAGNVVAIPDSIFAPVRTLTANIALEMAYAMDLHRQTLYVTGLLLLASVLALMGLSHVLSQRVHYEH